MSGIKVHHLNIGQPDLRSPSFFLDALRSYNPSVLAYETSQGSSRLRKAWASYIQRTLGLSLNPEHFLITMGASEALIFVFMLCADPEDEILVFDPTYANYIGFAAISGVKLQPVPCDLENGFALPDRAQIVARIKSKTRAILLSNPNNPTGTVYSSEDLKLLLDLCDEFNLFLIVDEAYREFVYDGLKPLSVFHLASNNPRVIVIDSLSKRFSLCGARIGALITVNELVMTAAVSLASARLAAPSAEQFAATVLFEQIHSDYVEESRSIYDKRRLLLFSLLSDVPDIEFVRPQGAFYSLVRLPVQSGEEFARFLLSDFSYRGATTFLAPAEGFFLENERGAQMVRIAYILNEEDIRSAVEILMVALAKFKN
jgi:aspartate aminotransferase